MEYTLEDYLSMVTKEFDVKFETHFFFQLNYKVNKNIKKTCSCVFEKNKIITLNPQSSSEYQIYQRFFDLYELKIF